MKTTTKATGLATVALAAVLGALPGCGDLQKRPPKNTIPVDLVATRPDGSTVLFTVAGIYVFDGLLLAQWNHIPFDALGVPPLNSAGPSGGDAGVLRFSLSADGNTAAVSFSPITVQGNTRIALYRMPGGELLNTFEPTVDPASPLYVDTQALSPDGSLLCALVEIVNGTTTMMMIDVATGTTLWTKVGAKALPVWSPDGATLFAGTQNLATADSSVEALDARSGALKWSYDLSTNVVMGLAVVGDGSLLAGAVDPPTDTPGMRAGDWPPFYPFWSAADGTPAMQVAPVAHTWFYATGPNGYANFACNGTDTCAAGLNEWNDPERQNFIHVYKPDGTVLLTLPTPVGKAINSMAISADGNFITIANPYDLGGGATVFSLVDGKKLNSQIFTTDSL